MEATGVEALKRAIVILGNQQAVAKAVGRTQAAVSLIARGKRVPAEWCAPIEHATNGQVTRHQLRPDLWPAEAA